MKVNNWRKNLATTLAACGLMSPAAAYAANLNTNLTTNGDFESVDLATTGEYNGPKILGWTGPNMFAYSHNGSSSNAGGVPDYADGDDPPGAGNWYFTSNNTGGAAFTSIFNPNEYYQDVSVAAGATGSAIAAGKGRVDIQAWMSSYLNDTDVGHVRVSYLDATNAILGFAQVDDSDPGPENVWNLNSGSGAIPVGTTTLRTSLFGTRTAGGGGADGYMDNIDVRIQQTANTQFLFLEVNTATGQTTLKNETGAAVRIDYYEVSSTGGALKANTWSSLQDQNSGAFPAGNGSGNGWEEAGGSGTGILSEGFLTGSSSVASAATVSLGAAFNTAGAQDLVFKYAVVPQVPLTADFDSDGDADGADFLAWQRGFGIAAGALKSQGDANADGAVNAADLALWKGQFGSSAFSGPGTLVRGFVKYVSGAVAAVPEPSSVLLVGMGLTAITAGRRRQSEN